MHAFALEQVQVSEHDILYGGHCSSPAPPINRTRLRSRALREATTNASARRRRAPNAHARFDLRG